MIFVILYVFVIVVLGILQKVDIVSSFTNGVKSCYNTLLNLFPSILFIVIGINIFTNSGITEIVEAFCERLKINSLLLMQLILRPISNSSSLIMMTKIFEQYGANSFLGKLSSVIQASSDTTIYIIMVYFSSVNIKKVGNTLIKALLANALIFGVAIVVSTLILNFFK